MKFGQIIEYNIIFFSRSILLTDQISLPNCLYFLRYEAIGVLQLFAVQSLTS